MKQFHVRIPQVTADAAKQYAEDKRWSFSEVVRYALERTLKIGPEKKKAAASSSNAQKLVGLWNAHCGDLPRVVSTLSDTRAKKAAAAYADHPKEVEAERYWKGVIRWAANDPFYSGKDDKWTNFNFDWLIKPGNHQKIYDKAVQQYRKNGRRKPKWANA